MKHRRTIAILVGLCLFLTLGCAEDENPSRALPGDIEEPPPTVCPAAFTFSDDAASFSFASEPCGVALAGASIRLRFERGGEKITLAATDFPTRTVEAVDGAWQWELSGLDNAPTVRLEVVLDPAGDRVTLWPTLGRGAGGPAWSVEWFEVVDAREPGLTLPEPTGRASWIQNGYDSWTFTGVEALADVLGDPASSNGTVLPCANNYEYLTTCDGFSWWFGAIGGDTRGPGLLWGALSSAHWKTYAAGWFPRTDRRRPRMVIVQGTPDDPRTLAAGGELELEAVWLMIAARPARDLYEYARAAAAVTPPKGDGGPAPFGWSTWYQYFSDIDERIVLDNCRELARRYPDREGLVCQIDDGYQTSVGDWDSYTDGFPAGMAAVADEIQGYGLRPAIWLAPLMADVNSEVFSTRPELFLRDEMGERVIFTDIFNPNEFGVLDVTVPAAAEFLRESIATKVAEGFTYLKLDFLFCGALEGVHADGSTALEHFDLAMAIIEDAAGPDVFLLASGEPWLPALGHFHAARDGADTVASFPGVPVYPADANLGRYHSVRAVFDGVWFSVDPDNLVARRPLTDSQVQVVTAMTWLTGSTLLGDSLTELSTETADRLFDPAAEALRDVDGRFWAIDLLDERVSWPIATAAFDLLMLANAPGRIWVREDDTGLTIGAFAWGLLEDRLEFSDHDLAGDFTGGVMIQPLYGAAEATLTRTDDGRWVASVPGQSAAVWRVIRQ
jgi:Melibiase